MEATRPIDAYLGQEVLFWPYGVGVHCTHPGALSSGVPVKLAMRLNPHEVHGTALYLIASPYLYSGTRSAAECQLAPMEKTTDASD